MSYRTFFVSASSAGRRHILQSNRMHDLFLDVLRHYRRQNKFRLHAFVMMPDHVHLLITPAPEITIERCVQLIRGGYSYRAKKELGVLYDIWNPGFSKSTVKDQEHFENVVKYIHTNPVKRGLVNLPEEYECSSASPGRKMDPSPFSAGAKAQSA